LQTSRSDGVGPSGADPVGVPSAGSALDPCGMN
jgi:hypothetical protein